MTTEHQKINEDEYEIVDMGAENFQRIRLTEKSKWRGVLFQFGQLSLIEEQDQLRVKYEYEIFENPNKVEVGGKKFPEYIGNILFQNLEAFLIYNQAQKLKEDSDD